MLIPGRTEEPYDAAFRSACKAGFYEWWPREDRLTWSAGLLQVYGLQQEPRGEAGFIRFVHPDDRVRVESETAAFLGSGADSFEHSFRIVRADGSVRFVLDRGAIQRDAQGVVQVIRGMNIDLTDVRPWDHAAAARQDAGEAETGAAGSREILDAILESTPDLVWAKDRAGRITFGNPALFEAIGNGGASGVLGGDAAELVPDAAQARAIEDNDAAVLRDGLPLLVEESLTRGGTTRVYQTVKAPLRSPEGAIIGIVGISRDITERKAAEAQLLARTRQLDLLSRTASRLWLHEGPEPPLETIFSDMAALVEADAFFHFRPAAPGILAQEITAGLDDAARAAVAVVRYGELLCGRVAESRAALVVENLQHASQPGADLLREWGAASYAGFPLLAHGRLIGTLAFASRRRTHFHEGELRTLQAICDQLAVALDRQRLERDLRDSDTRLRLALQASGAGAWQWHIPSGQIVWSPENHALYDVDPHPDGPSYTDWESRLHPEDRAATNAAVAAAVEGRTPEFRTEFRIIRRDGSTRWLAGLGQAEHGPDGTALHLSGINIDITERKLAEARIRENEERQTFLLRLSDALRPLSDPEAVKRTAASMLGRALDTSRTLYADIVDETWADIRDDHAHGVPSMSGRLRVEEFGAGLTAMFRRGETLVVEDAAQDTRFSEAERRMMTEVRALAQVSVGLVKNGRWVAALTVHSATPRAWTAAERQLVRETAERTWEAVERARAEAALRESERHLRLAMRAAQVGIWKAIPATGEFHASPVALQIRGLPPGTVLNATAALAALHPDDRPMADAAVQHTLEEGTPFQIETRIIRPDGAVAWVASSAERVVEGDQVSLVGLVQDITERKKAEAALQAAHDTFRSLVERSPFGVYVVDADFRLVLVSEGARRVFETVRPLIGRDFAEVLRILWPEPFATEAIGHFRHTLATGLPYHAPSTTEQRADIGQTEAYDWKLERITLVDGRPGVVCHFYDLSERLRHEAQVQMLMREVNHRAKNMLGLIQAIARNTAATDFREFLARFRERVQALAAAQDVLISSDWRAAPLADLVRSQLAHFSDLIGSRITLSGPPVAVVPTAAQALGMVLHELATNAVKHGSLSTATGRVAVTWAVQAEENGAPGFAISWEESGGPPVVAPTRRGFGSTLTTDMVRSSLGGGVAVDYRPAGLVWCLSCPAASVFDGTPPAREPTAPSPPSASADGPRVLVVEDEALIAAELEAMLVEAGYVVVGPAASVRDARELLGRFGCDAAVLDVNLGMETSEPVAAALASAGRPFIVVTGYALDQLPQAFRSAPHLEKPLRPDLLRLELERCLSAAGPAHVRNA